MPNYGIKSKKEAKAINIQGAIEKIIVQFWALRIYALIVHAMEQKGKTFDHDFMLLVNNVVQKMRTRVTNMISLYKLTNVFFVIYLF